MTVSTTSNIITYSGDGADTTWPFTFAIEDDDQIVVSVTDTAGTVTTIAAANYTVVLNAAVAPNPTPVGGVVTYPTSGAPLAVGTKITIERTAALTQPTSLVNQGTLYPTVIEQALDLLTMITQQVNTENTQSIRFAVSDDAHTRLPATAQIAGKYLAFDSSGNPTATAGTTSTNPVSSAMEPVVAAATLALGRTAFGLGTMAVETIGAGLEDDGAGAVRAINIPTTDAISIAVTSAFHQRQRVASAAITYTFPTAASLFDGFCFYVFVTGGVVTLAPNAADSIGTLASGTSFLAQRNAFLRITTDGVNTWYVESHFIGNLGAGAAIINGYLTCSRALGAETISLKALSGNDPSSMEPVYIAMRSATVGSGVISVRVVVGALSIVIPSTALMGFTANVGSRIWVTFIDNAGTIELAVINARDGINIYPLQGWGIVTTVAITTGADSAAVMYSTTLRAGVAYAPIAYLDWEDGLAVPGTWDTAPTRIQTVGYGVPLPGMQVQQQMNQTGAVNTGTTAIAFSDVLPVITVGNEYMTQIITPTSQANLLLIEAQAQLSGSVAGGNAVIMALFQDAVVNALAATYANQGQDAMPVLLSIRHMMLADIGVATTFRIRAGWPTGATTTFNGVSSARRMGGVSNSFLSVKEIMG